MIALENEGAGTGIFERSVKKQSGVGTEIVDLSAKNGPKPALSIDPLRN
jgi:hypothetical protein